ncbi:sucrase ferredoxin [Flindersiella endophytica]
MTRYVGCSAISQACGEQRFAKAGVTRGWILVEQPGPWGREPFGASGVIGRLQERLGSWPVKLLAIRRHGRSAEPRGRTAFVCHSGPREPWIERIALDDERVLLGIDPAGLCEGEPAGIGTPHRSPVYLVCTHGSKDVCCAVRGRPVAKALTAARPEQTWESSHVGGDRFAPNVVCLPHGIVYGHLAAETAGAAAEAYERGELHLGQLRGRSGNPPAAQAAEHLVRLRNGIRGIEAVAASTTTDLGDGRFDVDLEVEAGRLRARVRRSVASEARRLTCEAAEATEPPHWELVSVTVV